MSQENVKSLRRGYDAWNRRDFDTVLADAHPEFELRPLPSLGARLIRGHAEVKAFWATFFEGWDELRVEPKNFIASGEMVVAPLRWYGRGRDGIEVEQTSVDLWTFRAVSKPELRDLRQRLKPSKPPGCGPLVNEAAGPLRAGLRIVAKKQESPRVRTIGRISHTRSPNFPKWAARRTR